MKRIYDSSLDWYVADDSGLVHLSRVDQEKATKVANKLGPDFTAYKDISNNDDIMADFFGYVDLEK